MQYEPSGPVGHRPNPRNPGAAAPRGSSGWANRPSGSACQVSTSASVTGSPAPSKTRPVIVIAPGVSSGTTNGPSGHGSPIDRNGPTVCEGVSFTLPPSRDVVPKARRPTARLVVREAGPRRRDAALRSVAAFGSAPGALQRPFAQGVSSSAIPMLESGGAAATEHDVPGVAERP